MKSYMVNEVYRSKQGEGWRAGTDNVFLRFTGCNMQCRKEAGPLSPGGFDCDTEFASGVKYSLKEVIARVIEEDTLNDAEPCKWVIATGGEPGLQLARELIDALHDNGYHIAIETNGTVEVPETIDYIVVSPKVAEHAIRQKVAQEVRYVRGYGQALPKTVIESDHYFISPAFDGMTLDQRTLEWCQQLCKETRWKVSVQEHKIVGLR